MITMIILLIIVIIIIMMMPRKRAQKGQEPGGRAQPPPHISSVLWSGSAFGLQTDQDGVTLRFVYVCYSCLL